MSPWPLVKLDGLLDIFYCHTRGIKALSGFLNSSLSNRYYNKQLQMVIVTLSLNGGHAQLCMHIRIFIHAQTVLLIEHYQLTIIRTLLLAMHVCTNICYNFVP